jgi:hypothetical protein
MFKDEQGGAEESVGPNNPMGSPIISSVTPDVELPSQGFEAATSTTESNTGHRRLRGKVFAFSAILVVFGLVASGLLLWERSQKHVEPSGRASTMRTAHWGFNNPTIVDASEDALWVLNLGGGNRACDSYQNCPERRSQFPRALMKINPTTGLLEKALVESACPRQVKFSGRTVATTCSSQSIRDGVNRKLELQSNTCNSLNSPGLWTIASDSNFTWIQLSDSKFVEIDASTGRCWSVSLSFGSGWKYGSAWAVSDGDTVWIGEPSDHSSLIALDEQTRKIKFHVQLPMSLRSGFVLSAGKLWFVGLNPSKEKCFLVGRYQPCKQPFALFALDPTDGKVQAKLSAAKYGFGEAPLIDGFGTLELSADGDTVWVAASDAGNAVEVDASKNAVVRTIHPSKVWQPLQVVGGGKYFYVVLVGVQGVTPEIVNQYDKQSGRFVRKLIGAS